MHNQLSAIVTLTKHSSQTPIAFELQASCPMVHEALLVHIFSRAARIKHCTMLGQHQFLGHTFHTTNVRFSSRGAIDEHHSKENASVEDVRRRLSSVEKPAAWAQETASKTRQMLYLNPL